MSVTVLFIRGLFKDADATSNHLASSGRTITEPEKIWKAAVVT
jgi:hypothetical protein